MTEKHNNKNGLDITGYKRKAFLLWCRAGTRPFGYGFVKIDM